MVVKAVKCKFYNATIPCANGEYKQCVTNITCPTDGDPQICYAVWDPVKNLVKMNGCTDEPKFDNKCEQDRCVGQYKGPHMFCCCYNDFCNQEYFSPSLPPPITQATPPAEWTVVAYILLIIPFAIIAVFFITCCLGFCPYISRSREEIEAGMTELEFLQPPRQEGEDDEQDIEQGAATSCTRSPPEATAATQI